MRRLYMMVFSLHLYYAIFISISIFFSVRFSSNSSNSSGGGAGKDAEKSAFKIKLWKFGKWSKTSFIYYSFNHETPKLANKSSDIANHPIPPYNFCFPSGYDKVHGAVSQQGIQQHRQQLRYHQSAQSLYPTHQRMVNAGEGTQERMQLRYHQVCKMFFLPFEGLITSTFCVRDFLFLSISGLEVRYFWFLWGISRDFLRVIYPSLLQLILHQKR